jgi:serine/threonine-protein kinase
VLRGTYRIHRVLDRGGVGVVFEAEHLRLRRRVAIKVLARHLQDDEQALARFNREAEIISQLAHPNVVQVLDFDTTESGEPYLVMEYLTGRSLATLLAEHGQLELREVARLVYQAATGLAAAHRAAIVHRDLKPANLFLVEVPEEGTWVKLLDFGISHRLGRDPRLTGEHDLLGTPHYIAPEQVLGLTDEIGPRSDQYSLAVIAYEAIAGHPPFSGNLGEVLERVIANEPIPLARFVPEVARGVGLVLRQAMSKAPADRFANVLEFATALLASSGFSSAAASGERIPGIVSTAPAPPPVPAPEARASGAPRAGSTAPRDPSYRPSAREVADTEPPPPRRSLSMRPSDLGSLIEQARESFGLGDVDLAVSYLESALALADRQGEDQNPLLLRSSVMIESILQARLRSESGRLRIRLAPSDLALLPEQAFLLSRLEGHTALEEILDLSPLPRQKTLRHLVALLRQGVLALD